MFWCLVAVIAFLGVALLLALLAGDHRLRQRQAQYDHQSRRCLVASQLVAALRRALTPPPPPEPPGEPEPRISLAESSDVAMPAIVEEIEHHARENPGIFGMAIQSLIRGAEDDPVDPVLAAGAPAGSPPPAAT